MAFMGIAGTIVSFGFNLSGVRAISKHKNNKNAVNQIIGEITYARLVVAVVVFCVVILSSFFIDLLKENLTFTLLSFVGIVLTSILADFVFQSYEKMKSLTTRYILTKSLFIVGIFALVHSQESFWNMVGIAIASFVCCLLQFGLGRLIGRKHGEAVAQFFVVGGRDAFVARFVNQGVELAVGNFVERHKFVDVLAPVAARMEEPPPRS